MLANPMDCFDQSSDSVDLLQYKVYVDTGTGVQKKTRTISIYNLQPKIIFSDSKVSSSLTKKLIPDPATHYCIAPFKPHAKSLTALFVFKSVRSPGNSPPPQNYFGTNLFGLHKISENSFYRAKNSLFLFENRNKSEE